MRKFFIFTFLLVHFNIFAQNFQLKIQPQDSSAREFLKNKSQKIIFNDSSQTFKHLSNIIFELQKNGFASANFDSVKIDTAGNTTAYLFSGEIFYWDSLIIKGLDSTLLKNINLKDFRKQRFDYAKFREIQEKIIQFYENNGFPFASLHLQNVVLQQNKIRADLICKPNRKIFFDSFFIKGNSKISLFYLQKYLDIQPNTIYNEQKIRDISQKINELLFLREMRPAEVEFRNEKADIYLYLAVRKANQISGILGFSPKKSAERKATFTGEATLILWNTFSRGEFFQINYAGKNDNSQKLFTEIKYPYLFQTSFGINYRFFLQKQDSSFLTFANRVGIPYFFQYNKHIEVFFEYKKSAILLNEKSNIASFQNFSANIFGMSFCSEVLDYKWNARKGYQIYFEAGIANKKTDSTSIPMFQTQVQLVYYQPFMENWTLKLENNFALLQQKPKFFENELLKIGGMKTLRGFEEEYFATSMYSIFSIECRYLFEKNSNFHLFFDAAYLEKRSISGYFSDFPCSFGAGVTFETRAGIFTINYALGKESKNSVEFRNSKIHFGFINRF